MENNQYRKKVYMQTLSSSFINHIRDLIPKWNTDNTLIFASAYEFKSYNIEDETMEILPRRQG